MKSTTEDHIDRQVKSDIAVMERGDQPDGPTVITCPDCSGATWEVRVGDARVYQCRVGHRYSAESLIAEHETSLERTLWTLSRMLEERGSILVERSSAARRENDDERARDAIRRSELAYQSSRMIRDIVLQKQY